MVQAIINLGERQSRVLNIVKGKFGFKNKSDAINFILDEYEESLEPEIRPEYLEKLSSIKKEKGISFKNIDELKKIIKNA